MIKYYDQLIYTIKEISKGNIICDDEELDNTLKLALHEVYIKSDSNKLSTIVLNIAKFYFENGDFNGYASAFNEAVIDLYKSYEEVNKEYFNGNEKEIEDIKKFYKKSLKNYLQIN